ncbi:GNAT family N-acetyltransferase [Streptomyces sp. NPDC004065]|uniref:GNAT family N-acetyltransferase n=1 Tax=Streptomyces sp. NPDC004065 TaxID=3364689 RepID=UPI00384CEC37
MDHAAVLALYDRDLREGAVPDGPGARVERTASVVRQVGSAHDWNGVLWSAPDIADPDGVIAEQIARFAAAGHGFEWELYGHDRPADLGRRLRAAGFTPGPEETLMVGETAGPALDAEPPAGVRLRTVTEATGVDLLVEVHERVFGTDGSRLRQRLLDRLTAAPDTIVAVVALDGDEPVSAGRLEFVPGTGFAGLWGGGTVEGRRGQGLYRALVALRARLAAERGCRYLQVDATSRSRPILERLGFTPLTTTTPYSYDHPEHYDHPEP